VKRDRVYVGEIRHFLEERGWSPEVFAREVGLSHMTIRRWLSKRDNTPLPKKYNATLGPRLAVTGRAPKLEELYAHHASLGGFSARNVDEMVDDLEKSGREFEGVRTLDRDVSKKLGGERFDQIFARHCKILLQAVFSKKTSAKKKAIAVGALVYFLNPIDLIPDNIPVVGYLDDLAVLTLAVGALSQPDDRVSDGRKLAPLAGDKKN
jgi:uncharacterized membrane protein YkvA (DUF1232 family)